MNKISNFIALSCHLIHAQIFIVSSAVPHYYLISSGRGCNFWRDYQVRLLS